MGKHKIIRATDPNTKNPVKSLTLVLNCSCTCLNLHFNGKLRGLQSERHRKAIRFHVNARRGSKPFARCIYKGLSHVRGTCLQQV